MFLKPHHWLLRVLWPALLPLLLAACASTSTAPAPETPPAPRLALQLAPATLGTSLSLQQHLKVERGSRSDDLDTVLEIDDSHLALIALAFGQRVMSLQYDGKELKTWRHPMLPRQVQGEDVLRDVQLTLWPAAAIRAALPAGWELQESADGWRRTLLQDQQIVAQIDYPDHKRWGGTVILSNLRYQYTLTIQSVVTAP